MSSVASWKLEGEYFEGCNCNTVCPCVYLGPPDEGSCYLTIAWHITKGHDGETNLNGLNVVAMFHTPGHMVTGPKWNAALYFDSRAKPPQMEALKRLFSGKAGGFLGEVAKLIGSVKGMKSVPIEFTAKGRSRSVRISGVLDLEVEALKGRNAKEEPTLHNVPFYGAFGFDPVVAQSKRYSYHDHGYSTELSGKNAFFSRFAYGP